MVLLGMTNSRQKACLDFSGWLQPDRVAPELLPSGAQRPPVLPLRRA
jgi:hypothetical protein